MALESNEWMIIREDIHESYRNVANQMLLKMKVQGKAENTLKKYRWFLEKFLVACPIPMSEFKNEHLLGWIQNYGINKKPKTIDLVLAVMSQFLNECHDLGYLEDIVIKKRWRPKIEKPLPKYLELEEIAKVELVAEKLPLRDRLLITFLLSSGCRTIEAINLRVDDINLATNTAQVLGKGKKTRTVHFSENCSLLFKEYLASHPKELEYVFYHKFKKKQGFQRLKHSGIYLIVVKLGKQAGLDSKLFPHRLRHTFATNLLMRGASLEFIQHELGQEDPDTTRIYARVPKGQIIIEYAKVMD